MDSRFVTVVRFLRIVCLPWSFTLTPFGLERPVSYSDLTQNYLIRLQSQNKDVYLLLHKPDT